MLEALNMMSIAQSIKLNVLIMIYKMIHGLTPNYLTSNLIFTRQIHAVNTRQNNNNLLRLPAYRLEQTQRNIFYNGVKLYNELPRDIKSIETLNRFKIECTKYIKTHYEII